MLAGHWGTPAFAKKTSSPPKVASARSPIERLSSARVTSAARASARPPPFSICSTVALAAASLMSTTTIRAPSAAMASAEAAPMPEPAPVTIATRFSSFIAPPRLEPQLGHEPDRVGVARHHQGGDTGRRPLGEALADERARPAERDLVHQRVGHGRLGLGLAAAEVQILDRPRRLLVAVAPGQLVVEVLATRPHAADVEGQPRLHRSPALLHPLAHDHGHRRHDVEARAGLRAIPARRPKARVEPLAEHRHASRREEDGDPAVGDLGGQGHVLWPDGGEIDRDGRAPVENRAEGLAEAGGPGARIRDLVVLAPELDGLLAAKDRTDDLHVFARLHQRLAEGLPVPALDDLRPRHAQPHPEPPARERIERHRRHRRHRWRAPGSAMPSPSSRIRWVSTLLIRARGLMPPRALTTRCQGRSGGQPRRARPTARAARGRPRRVAIWP